MRQSNRETEPARERYIDREREIKIHREIMADSYIQTQRKKHADTDKTDKHTDTYTEREAAGDIERQCVRQLCRGIQRHRETDRDNHRQRQTETERYIQIQT